MLHIYMFINVIYLAIYWLFVNDAFVYSLMSQSLVLCKHLIASILRICLGFFSVHQVSKGEESSHRRSGRKKNRERKKNKNITAVQPKHASTHKIHSSTADPCLTSHLDYCIHGHCTYLHDLREPVCMSVHTHMITFTRVIMIWPCVWCFRCKRGYDGERCGIQLLHTSGEPDDSGSDTTHTALIIMAVVLSIISCLAILLIICVQWVHTQHNTKPFVA